MEVFLIKEGDGKKYVKLFCQNHGKHDDKIVFYTEIFGYLFIAVLKNRYVQFGIKYWFALSISVVGIVLILWKGKSSSGNTLEDAYDLAYFFFVWQPSKYLKWLIFLYINVFEHMVNFDSIRSCSSQLFTGSSLVLSDMLSMCSLFLDHSGYLRPISSRSSCF